MKKNSILFDIGGNTGSAATTEQTVQGQKLNRLQQLQQQISSELEFLPVKQEKEEEPVNTKTKLKGKKKAINDSGSKPANGGGKSILLEDIFIDKEQQREKMLKMFVDVQPGADQENSNNGGEDTFNTFERDDSELENQSHNSKNRQMSQGKRSITKKQSTNRSSFSSLREDDFDLTKTGKHASGFKSVQFKQGDLPPKDVITKDHLSEAAQAVVSDNIMDIRVVLQQIKHQSDCAEQGIKSSYTCENTKLLEVVMEHILFHWEDVMACLVDELIEEEVLELNKIEQTKAAKQHNLHLADKSMSGKFHDYKSVDLREIMQVFDDYKDAQKSLENRM